MPILLRILLTSAFLVMACGPSARDKAIHQTFVGLNAARDGFIAWDKTHQAEIVEKAATKDEGTASLAAYRAERATVIAAFELAYHTIATAVLVDDKKQRADVLLVVKTASDLHDALRKLTGK